MRFVIEIFGKDLIKLNDSLRSKFKKSTNQLLLILITQEQFLELLNSNADPDFTKSVITDVLWEEKFYKNTIIVG